MCHGEFAAYCDSVRALTTWVGLTLLAPQEAGTFRWNAPAECPDEAQMSERLASAGGFGRLAISATVLPQADGSWRMELVLELDEHRESRLIEGRSCESLADAVELLTTLERRALEPVSPLLLPEAPDTQVPEPIEVTDGRSPTLELSPPPTEQERRPRRDRTTSLPTGLLIGGAVGLGIGQTPAPSVPIELALGWSARWLRAALRGRYHVPRSVDSGPSAPRIQLGTAGIELCGRPAHGRVEFPICGQVSVGGSRSDRGGTGTQSRGGVWLEAGVDVGVAWSLTPNVALTARLGAAAVILGTRYALDGETFFDPTRVVGRVVFGFEGHVPIRMHREPEN